MSFGKQFVCMSGAGSFLPQEIYYYSGDRPAGQVLMITFMKSKHLWKVIPVELSRVDFEDYLSRGILIARNTQSSLPPWLSAVEGTNFMEVEGLRYKKKKKTANQQVQLRVTYIGEAVGKIDQILASKYPMREISAFASSHGNKVNRARFQLWFFSYVLHGRNPWSLKAATDGCGKWLREDTKHRGKKFGRKSINKKHSFNSSSVGIADMCVKAFLRHAGVGDKLIDIYIKALLIDIGCKVVDQGEESERIFHPQNKPFPSYSQFRYRVIKVLGYDKYKLKLVGPKHFRQTKEYHEGTFTQQYSNILECCEVDVFQIEELPRQLYSAEPAQALFVARAICVTTSAVVGVGFSIGSESKVCYRSMLFCCAVPKSLIGRMFGLSNDQVKNWIMQASPAYYKSDRGPGGGKALLSERELLEEAVFDFPIRALTPSGEGQSKALAESTHPRSPELQQAPHTVLSDLNTVEMMRRELFRAISETESKNITARLPPRDLEYFSDNNLKPSPLEYWRYLEERCRSSARQIPLDTAIRTFLERTTLSMNADGVELFGQTYTSDQLKATSFFRHRHPGVASMVTGYVFIGAVRLLWIEIEGQLIEVEIVIRARVGDEEKFLTLPDLERIHLKRKELDSRGRSAGIVGKLKRAQQFHETVGKHWNNNTTKAGRTARKDRGSKAEKKVLSGQVPDESH